MLYTLLEFHKNVALIFSLISEYYVIYSTILI